MFAKEFIFKDIPTLYPADSGMKAQELMNAFKLHHLPVVERNRYLGLISDQEIARMKTLTEPVGRTELFAPRIQANRLWPDVVQFIDRFHLSVLPVVSENRRYIGCITLDALISRLNKTFNLWQEGTLLIVEVNIEDYTVSGMAQLIEANNAKLLSFFSVPDEKTNTLTIYLKVNLEDTSSIIQSFERFNYTVKHILGRNTENNDDLQEKLDEFLHYLNI